MIDFHTESFLMGFSIALMLFIAYNLADLIDYLRDDTEDDI